MSCNSCALWNRHLRMMTCDSWMNHRSQPYQKNQQPMNSTVAFPLSQSMGLKKKHVWFGYIIYVPCQVGGTNQPTYVGVGDWQVESLQPKIVLGGLLAIFAQAGWCGVNQTSPTGGNWGCVAVSLDGEGNLLGNLLEVQAHFLQKGHPCGANVVDGCQVYLWGNVFVTLFKPNRPPPQGEE